MKLLATTFMKRAFLVVAMMLGILLDLGLRAATVTSDTVATYRTIAIARFKELKAVREAIQDLKAQGYVLYAKPTVILLSADCESQVGFCNPIYFVTQGAGLGRKGHYSEIQVVGAMVSPTTFFGSEDWMIPPDKWLNSRPF